MLSFDFGAWVVKGESPLWRLNRPWRLKRQEASPDSYAACEILTRTELPITILEIGRGEKVSPESLSERAWAKDLPETGGPAVESTSLFTVESRFTMNGQGHTMSIRRSSCTEQVVTSRERFEHRGISPMEDAEGESHPVRRWRHSEKEGKGGGRPHRSLDGEWLGRR